MEKTMTTAETYGGPLQKGGRVRDRRTGHTGRLAFTVVPTAMFGIVEWDRPEVTAYVESAVRVTDLETIS